MSNEELFNILSKWFEEIGIDSDNQIIVPKYLFPKKSAITLEEAWEKTFSKWYLIAKSNECIEPDSVDTCGLCNLFLVQGDDCCINCPIYYFYGHKHCSYSVFDKLTELFEEYEENEYLSEDDKIKWNNLVFEEILLLCNTYNEWIKSVS